MSEAVDTRIVEAKFDSAQFEKGVDRTVKKLDELKKSLNLEESGKSIADLASKTQSVTEQVSSSLEKLENRFTSFTGMLKQKLLSGIADEIVGAFFKIKNSVEGMIRSLSSAQVSVGLSKYEQMLTSVRTMVASGSSEESAYAAIETLGLYADQTSYSLDQMTSALSKMKAAGVGLEEGTKAVEGISNACAIAGINATDASRAFYNLSQAYSSGYLKYTDYRSLELLNMTTKDFKENMLEAAVTAGTLKKTAEGVYKTINTKDKKVTAGKTVTVKTLADSLRYNFMNTEAMNTLFGDKYFFDEEKWKELKDEFKKLGKTEEEALAKAKELYGETAVNAYFAAREARSFTDVISTLKDVISRGWAKSFELIFGKLTDAKDFFTWLTENEFAEAIYAIGDFRNNVLEIWSNRGGREDFIEALHNIDDVLGEILNKTFFFLSGDTDLKAERIGYSLIAISRDFANFTAGISDWLNSSTDAKKTRLDRIKDVFDVFGAVLKATLRIVKISFNTINNLLALLSPVFDSIISALSKIAVKINEVLNPRNNAYIHFQDILKNIITVATPFVGVISKVIDVLGEVASFFIDIAAGTFTSNLQFFADALGFIIEMFNGESNQKKRGKGVIDGIRNDIVAFGDACKEALKAMGDFFTTLFDDLRKVLGISPKDGEKGGAFAGLRDFFDTNEFIQNVKSEIKDLPNKVKRLFWKKGFSEEIYKNISKYDTKSAEQYKNAFKGPLTRIMDSFTKAVKDFLKKVQDKTKDLWNTILDFFLGKKTGETQVVTDDNGNTRVITERIKEGFSKWLDDTLYSVKTWITSIPDKISKLWDSIIDFIFGKEADPEVVTDSKTGKTTIVVTRIKEGFSLWLSNLPNKIKEHFSTLKDSLKKVWNTIVDFIFGREATADEISKAKAEGVDLVNTRVKEGFSLWLSELPGKLTTFIQSIPDHIKNIWNTVVDFIFGVEADADAVTDTDVENTTIIDGRIKTGFSLWFYNLTEKVKTWAKDFRNNISEIWDVLIGAIFGSNASKGPTDEHKKDIDDKFSSIIDSYERNLSLFGSSIKTNELKAAPKEENSIIESVKETANFIGEKIAEIISNIPTYVAGKVNFGLSLAGTVFENVSKWFDKINSEDYRKMFNEDIEAFVKAIQEGDTTGLSPFAVSIIEIGKKIKGFITETIPGILSGAYTFISDESGNLLRAILGIFDISDWSQVEEKAKNIGEEIANNIKKIPDFIALGVDSIKKVLTEKHGVGYSETEQAIFDQFTDEQGRINIGPEFRAAMNKSADTIAKEKEGWSIWSVIKDIGVSIKDAFVELGPSIIDGINFAIEKIKEGLLNLTNLFKEKDDTQSFGDFIEEKLTEPGNEQYSDLWESAKNLGETIKTVLTDVIPGFIKEAFGEIVSGIPRIIDDLFGNGNTEIAEELSENAKEVLQDFNEVAQGDNQTEKVRQWIVASANGYNSSWANLKEIDPDTGEMKDIETSLTGFGQIMQVIGNVFSGFTENNTAMAVAKIAGIIAIIWGINSIIDNLVISDDAWETVKWTAIETAILGIVGVIGYLIYLSETGDETKIKNVERVFDSISKLFDKLIAFFTLKSFLNFGSSVANAVGTIKGAGGVLATGGKALGAGIAKIAGIFGGVILGVDVLTEASSGWSENITETFEKTGVGLDDLVRGIEDLASINDKIDAAKDAIGSIADVFGKLHEVFTYKELISIEEGFEPGINEDNANLEDLEKAKKHYVYQTKTITEDFNQIMTMFVRFSGAMSLFKESITTDKWKDDSQSVLAALQSLVGMKDDMAAFAEFSESSAFEQFKKALMSIGSALQLFTFSDIGDADTLNNMLENWKIENAIALLDQFFGHNQLHDLIDKLDKAEIGDAGKTIENAENIAIFAGALVTIARACSQITDKTGEQIEQLFTTLESITPRNDEEMTTIVQQFGELGNAMGSFAASTSGLTEANIGNAEAALKMILQFAVGLKDIPSNTLIAKMFTGDKSITNFGIGIENLGQNLSKFFDSIQNNGKTYDRNNLEQVLMTIDTLGYVAKRLGSVTYSTSSWQNTESWLTKPFGDLSGFGTNIMSFIDEINAFKTTDEKDIDFEVVFNVLESIQHLAAVMTNMPIDNIEKKVKSAGEILIGKGNNNHKGILGFFNEFFAEIINIAKRDGKQLDLKTASEIINSYAEMASAIWVIMRDAVSSEKDKLVGEDVNPISSLIPVFEYVNNNFSVFSTFLDNASMFNKEGLGQAQDFFTSLYNLAMALDIFSKHDSKTGEFNVLTGLSTLLGFNWTALTSVKDNMMSIFSSEDFKVVGKTAGEYLDEGLAEGIGSGNAIQAMKDLAKSISGTFKVEMEINSPSKLFYLFGKFIGMGLGKGIEVSKDDVLDIVTELGVDILGCFNKGKSGSNIAAGAKEFGTNLIDNIRTNIEERLNNVWNFTDGKSFGANLLSHFFGNAKDYIQIGKLATEAVKKTANNVVEQAELYYEKVIANENDKFGLERMFFGSQFKEKPIISKNEAIKNAQDEIKSITREMSIYKNDINQVKTATDLNPVSEDYTDAQIEAWEKRIQVLRTKIANFEEMEEEYVYNIGELAGQGFTYNKRDTVRGTARAWYDNLIYMGKYLVSEMKDFNFSKYMPQLYDLPGILFDPEGIEHGITNYIAKMSKEMAADLETILTNTIVAGSDKAIENGLFNNTDQTKKYLTYLQIAIDKLGLKDKLFGTYTDEENNAIEAELEAMAKAFDEMDPEDSTLSPVITPVVDMTNIDTMEERMRNLGLISTPTGSLSFNLPQTSTEIADHVIPPNPSAREDQINEVIRTLVMTKASVDTFSSSLANTRFNITGRDLVYSIAPDIDEHIGREVVYQDRS